LFLGIEHSYRIPQAILPLNKAALKTFGNFFETGGVVGWMGDEEGMVCVAMCD
jgi:hypothetical protein